MNVRTILSVAVAICLLVVGCRTPSLQGPIINPVMIDQKEANERFLAKYSDVVVKADRAGIFGAVTAICRQIQTGAITLVGVKSSKNGRYHVFMFKEKVPTGSSPARNYTIAAFYFNPGSGLFRSCDKAGRCDVYVKNGFTRFGYSNIDALGDPEVGENGISIKFNDDRYFSFDFLFSYEVGNKQEGEELVSIFLSAFPVLGYE
jgi:hypothetical protein